MTTHQYVAHIKSIFSQEGDPDRALGQMAYLRHQFEFYGLKSQEWVAHSKLIFTDKGLFDGEDLQGFARLCFEDEHREMHYIALQMVEKQLKKQAPAFIAFLQELIATKSWWDSVDWIAKLVGLHFKKHPHLIVPVTEAWMASGNFWLQRVCLIFQLTYRADTDFELMKKYIRQLSGSREFFLQKGAGWALRQYSKTNPKGVQLFIEANPQLAALTRREGMKWINSNGAGRPGRED